MRFYKAEAAKIPRFCRLSEEGYYDEKELFHYHCSRDADLSGAESVQPACACAAHHGDVRDSSAEYILQVCDESAVLDIHRDDSGGSDCPGRERRAGAEVGYRIDGDRSAAADCVLGNGVSSVFRGIDYPYTSDSGMAVIESDGVSYSGNFYRHKAVEYGEIAGKQNNPSDSDSEEDYGIGIPISLRVLQEPLFSGM